MAFAVANQLAPPLVRPLPKPNALASPPLISPYKKCRCSSRLRFTPSPTSPHHTTCLPLIFRRSFRGAASDTFFLASSFATPFVTDRPLAPPSKQASSRSRQELINQRKRSMESVVHGNGGSGGLVVTELSHIKELVRQLQGHLGGSQSRDLCKHLASQISSITERSISLITSFHLDACRKRPADDVATALSPLSDASDAPFKASKKRKTMEKKRHQVRVSSAGAGGGDIPVDDGHSWRKYGQKEILGAKHPRSYYRCTHRPSQGCAATKQVQRTDQDKTLFDVVYLGDHTCVQRAVAGQAATGAPAPEHNPCSDAPLQSLSSNLTIKIEGLAVEPELLQGPFCLLSTPVSGCLAQGRGPSAVPSTSENRGVSPATSYSNHVVPLPAFEVAGDVQFGFEEVMSVFGFDDCVEDLDIDVSSFFV